MMRGYITSLAPHKGKVIYIDVWGSWCGPCREEMKHASAIKESLKGKDVVFFAKEVRNFFL